VIPHDTIAKLDEVYRAVSALGARLTEEQWKSPSDLPGWTVQDNLSHLIGTERTLQGLPGADRSAPVDAAHVKNLIGEFNEREVEMRRGRSGAEVLAEWNDLVEQRLATLRGADDAYFDAETMTPTGPGTVGDFLHIRVLDLWSHLQDIRRALAREGGYEMASAAHTIDRLTRTLPIVVGKRAATPEGASVRIEITGPVARSLTYEVRGGRATEVQEPTSAPVATITMDCDTFTVLALGRSRADARQDRIEITGDRELGRRIVDNLAMMI